MKSFQISDPADFTANADFFINKLSRSYIKHKMDFFVFRDKTSSKKQLKIIANCLGKIQNRYKTKFIINTHQDLVKKPLGIWLNSKQFKQILPLRKKGFFVIVSTHSLQDLRMVFKKRANLASFSPIFYSKGKSKPKGTKALKEINDKMRPKIIALGGINKTNLAQLEGIYGYAAISYFR